MIKINRIKKIFVIIVEIVLQMLFFFPWISMYDRGYNAPAYLIRVFTSGDVLKIMRQDLSESIDLSYYTSSEVVQLILPFLLEMIIIVFIQCLCMANLLVRFLKRDILMLNTIALASSAAAAFVSTIGPAFDSSISLMYPIIILGVLLIEFLGVRMINAWQDANEEYAELKARDEAWKTERKKRLAFPGKYTRLFYQAIWKNFKSGWKDYVLFVLSGIFSAGMIFAGIGIAEVLSPLNGGGSILRGHGLGAFLVNFLVIIFAVSIFLIGSVLVSYLRKRMKNYGIFVNLGIRRKTLYIAMGLEIAGCMFLTLVGGTIVGNILLSLAGIVIRRIPDIGNAAGSISVNTYLFSYLSMCIIFFLALLAVHEIYMNTAMTITRDRAIEKEKMPGKYRAVFLGVGIFISVYAVLNFAQRKNAEGILILLLLFAGLFLVFKNGWGMWLAYRRKDSKKYYSTLIRYNSLYYRFKTTFRYAFFIGVVHIAVLFLFSKEMISAMTAQEPESLFPYDFMCMAAETDNSFFGELKEKYQVEIHSYPMVRVTNVDNTEMPENFRYVIQPQGQHIGISESTYKQLNHALGKTAVKMNLADDGSEVYIIYQQDRSVKAHPIDYFLTRTEPYLHIGQPVLLYDYMAREKIYPKRKVAGEKIEILTGAYRRGDYENIVVFSDKYFEKIQDSWKETDYLFGEEIKKSETSEGAMIHEWPTKLVLMNVDEKSRAGVENELLTFKKAHAFDEKFDNEVLACYSSKEQISQIKAERIMTVVVNIFIIGILLIVSIFILYLKFESEMEEKRERREFLLCIGMKYQERIQVLKAEVRIYIWMPFIMTGIIAPILTAIIWKLRQYTQADCISYMKVWGILAAGYLVIQVVGMKIIELYIVRKVEGKYDTCPGKFKKS